MNDLNGDNATRATPPNRHLPPELVLDVQIHQVLDTLTSPLRRRILDILHEAGEARSPKELSRLLKRDVSNVGYHVGLLLAGGALIETDTRKVSGATEHFYASTVASDAFIRRYLREMRPLNDAN